VLMEYVVQQQEQIAVLLTNFHQSYVDPCLIVVLQLHLR